MHPRLFVFLKAVSLCLIFLATGNTEIVAGPGEEFLQSSQFSSGTPYKIIRKSDDPHRPDGVYVANEKGEWQLALEGHVLAGLTNQGVIGELSVTHLTGLFESLVVLDGELALIDVRSRTQQPESMIRFSDVDHSPVDMFSRAKFQLRPIESLNDISVHFIGHDSGGQSFLISLAQSSPFGSGVTFLCRLKKTKGAEMPELQSSPLVIDYEYRRGTSLSHLVSGSQVYSALLLQKFSASSRTDSAEMIQWKFQLRHFLDRLNRGEAIDKQDNFPLNEGVFGQPKRPDVDFVPFIHSIHLEPQIKKKPEKWFQFGGRVGMIGQVYDPIGFQNQIVFQVKDKVNPLMNASIDLDPDTGEYLVFDAPAKLGGLAFVVNEQLFFAREFESANKLFVRLFNLEAFPAEMRKGESVYVVEMGPEKDGRRDHYIFRSWRSESGEEARTDVFVIEQKETSMNLIGRLQLSEEFYSREVLLERIKRETPHGLLFDYLTAESESVEDYRRNYNSAFALVNVSASVRTIGNRYVQNYLRPISEFTLSPRVKYLEYDPTGVSEPHSGIVLSGKDSEAREIQSELLYDSKSYELGEPVSLNADLSFSDRKEKTLSAKLILATIDPRFQGGRRGFTLFLNLETESSSAFDLHEVDIDYSRVKNIQIVPGFSQFDRRVVVFIEVEGDPQSDSKNSKAGIYIVELQIQNSEQSSEPSFKLAAQKRLFIAFDSATDDIFRLIGADKQGRIYWTLTPELDPRHPDFAVFDIFEKKKILPSNQRGRQLAFGAQAQELGMSVRQRDQSVQRNNPWLLQTHKHLKRVAELESTDSEKEKLVEALKLYKGLVQHLEALGDPQNPARHEILLVSKSQKTLLRKLLRFTLDSHHNDSSIWNLYSSKTNIAWLDVDAGTQPEILRHLSSLAHLSSQSRSLLLSDASDLIRIGRPNSPNEDDEIVYRSDDQNLPDDQALPHILDLIVRGGRPRNPQDFQKPIPEAEFSSLIIASPEDLETLQTQWPEAVVTNLFESNVDFMEASWRVWEPDTTRAAPATIQLSKMPRNELETELLVDLFEHLKILIDPDQKPKRRVFLIPDELKSVVEILLLKAWAQDPGQSRYSDWNSRNPLLRLFRSESSELSQLSVLENLRAMRGNGRTRSLLWGSLAMILKINRPSETGGQPYLISDPADQEDGGSAREQIPPHLLWLIATDGRKISAEEFSEGVEPLASSLLIGTHKEWEDLKKNLVFEDRFGLTESFDVFELQPPSLQTMKKILSKVVERPAISALRYQFVASGESADPRTELLAFLVNKTRTLAQQYDIESTSAFLRVLGEFQSSLIEDQELRRNRVIDRNFMERLLTRVFNIPLNILTLEENDPDRVLSDVKKVSLALQNAGYLGPLELKYRVIETLLSHVKGKTAGLNVPSSLILLGDTSTGKTYLFKKLIEVLKLELYDFDDPYNSEANAIVINVGEITTTEGDPRHIDEVISHLENFLSLPNGYRGFILFDDMHKAGNSEILQKLVAFQTRLFEAKEGLVNVFPLDQDFPKQVTVRNLKMVVTLNPPSDSDLRKRYASSGQDVDLVVASLARDKVNIERSFPARFSSIINLSQFPVEAKGPALSRHLSEQTQIVFNTAGQFILVDPLAIQQVSKKFPHSHAREFLNTAGASILELPQRANFSNPISLVVPSRFSMADLQRESLEDETLASKLPDASEGTGRSQTLIEGYVEESMMAIPLEKSNLMGNLLFLSLLSEGVRTHVFQSLVSALTESIALNETREMRSLALSPLLHGVTSHLREYPQIPLSVLNIDPFDYGIRSKVGKEEFVKRLMEIDGRQNASSFFPFQFSDEFSSQNIYQTLTVRGFLGGQERTRTQVITEVSDELVAAQERILSILLQVSDPHQLPVEEDWLARLQEDDALVEMRRAGEDLVQRFWDFHKKLSDSRLIEANQGDETIEPTIYESFRLYLIALDRAFLRLPWAKTQIFLLNAMQIAAQNLEYGQRSGVQHYFFKSRLSVLRPGTKTFIYQLARSSSEYSSWKPDQITRRETRFKDRCSRMLSQMNKGILNKEAEGGS